MKWAPSGISTRISSLLAAVAVLSICKLVFLAIWSGFQPSPQTGDFMAETVVSLPSQAYAQNAAPIQDAVQTAQAEPQGNLSEEWETLRRRQEELQRKEDSLQSLERELDDKLNRLQNLEQRIQAMLDEADVLQDKKIKHLVDVYSNMKPKEAAKALEVLEEPVAVKILTGMRGRNAGEILSFVDSEKAARLTEALTRMQVPLQ
jgi:flagellar motility protein MotE (MotC chaperone)